MVLETYQTTENGLGDNRSDRDGLGNGRPGTT